MEAAMAWMMHTWPPSRITCCRPRSPAAKQPSAHVACRWNLRISSGLTKGGRLRISAGPAEGGNLRIESGPKDDVPPAHASSAAGGETAALASGDGTLPVSCAGSPPPVSNDGAALVVAAESAVSSSACTAAPTTPPTRPQAPNRHSAPRARNRPSAAVAPAPGPGLFWDGWACPTPPAAATPFRP
eukprot:scaffold20366_cov79-Isochrysis_galbana.AAC.1